MVRRLKKKKKVKMAAPVSEKIPVIVVDGVLENLHRLGFPLSALVSMQAVGAKLSEASWNVRQTASSVRLRSVSAVFARAYDCLSGIFVIN